MAFTRPPKTHSHSLLLMHSLTYSLTHTPTHSQAHCILTTMSNLWTQFSDIKISHTMPRVTMIYWKCYIIVIWQYFLIAEMSELLFECYHVPSVAYGVDSLFSLQYNQPGNVCLYYLSLYMYTFTFFNCEYTCIYSVRFYCQGHL